ncbi:mannosyl-oligosaccharide alpha-1,2-mannosidase, partial [Tulasnella sp. 331]
MDMTEVLASNTSNEDDRRGHANLFSLALAVSSVAFVEGSKTMIDSGEDFPQMYKSHVSALQADKRPCWFSVIKVSDTEPREPKIPGRFNRPKTKGQASPSGDEDWKKRGAIVDAFKRDAFGYDEYYPLSHTGSYLSGAGVGYSIVDSIDTMMLMKATGDREIDGMYNRAKKWIDKKLDFSQVGQVNTFETTIRVLGGLLSAHALSASPPPETSIFLKKAIDLADRMLPTFITATGIPLSSTDLKEKTGYADMSNGGAASTAEATTLQLEFRYLSHLTGIPDYWAAVVKTNRAVRHALLPEGPALVPIFISPRDGRFVSSDIRLGSRGDSYYEYLLLLPIPNLAIVNYRKQYLQTNRTEDIYRIFRAYRSTKSTLAVGVFREKMYDNAMDSIHEHLLKRSPSRKLLYTSEFHNVRWPSYDEQPDVASWHVEHKQDHLVCFLGGSLMLGATEAHTSIPPKARDLTRAAIRDWNSGQDLIETCMATHETATGLSPEIAMFFDKPPTSGPGSAPTSLKREWYIKGENRNYPLLDARYILRPETIESLFIAYRLTGDKKYRSAGWKIFSAIEKHCKIPTNKGGGYASIRNVDNAEGEAGWVDKMETFFI